MDDSIPTVAPADAPAAADGAAAYAPDADTWDHVVRAAAHCDQLEAAALLMRATREHAHDPELLARTRGVRGEHGLTLLMRAVARGDVARAAEIVGAAPTPAARAELLAYINTGGLTALHYAFSLPHTDEDAALALVELLLGVGADPLARYRDPNGRDYQPMHYAAQWSARIVQRLVSAGASIDGDVVGVSTLFCAAGARTARGVRMIPALVALGARETLGNEAMVAFAEWPVEGAPASDEEMRAALTALVSVGCSLTEPGADGYMPMDLAARRGNAPVVRALLALGVDANHRDQRGRTALMHALLSPFADATDAPQMVAALLDAGADANARDANGNTPLHHVAVSATDKPWAVDAARLLLGSGAKRHATNDAGATPADCVPAGAGRDSELYRLLLEAEGEGA